jgi:alpha-galactosidase
MTNSKPVFRFVCFAILCNVVPILALHDGLCLTPPMGWSSWYCMGGDITEAKIKAIADSMVSSGMKAAGYEYVNIDDGWAMSRDSLGYVIENPTRFPSGMKALADYIHSKGMKFGIYTCSGELTCMGLPGSNGYERQDAEKYAEWGVDWVKNDACYDGGKSIQYSRMYHAIQATGRPMVINLCNWTAATALWGDSVGHCWRVTGDVGPRWNNIIGAVDQQAALGQYAGPGHWNDPDNLYVGQLSDSIREVAHFSLFAILNAPLVCGNDLCNMSSRTRMILTNAEVIAVNQDSLGVQGDKVPGANWLIVKTMKDGSKAVVFFNRSETSDTFTVTWAQLGFANGTEVNVRDLWKHEIAGNWRDFYRTVVPSNGVCMIRAHATPDTIRPVLLRAMRMSDTTVLAIFSEPIDPATAADIAHYAISPDAGLYRAVPGPDSTRSIMLFVADIPAVPGYSLTVNGLKDNANVKNTMISNSSAAIEISCDTLRLPAERKLTGTIMGKCNATTFCPGTCYDNAVDNDTSTFPDCALADSAYAGYDLGSSYVITSVRFLPRTDWIDRMIGMIFEGSRDNNSWDPLYLIRNVPSTPVWTSAQISPIVDSACNLRSCRYVRLNNGFALGGYLNVREVEFYGFPLDSLPVFVRQASSVAGLPVSSFSMRMLPDRIMIKAGDRDHMVRVFAINGALVSTTMVHRMTSGVVTVGSLGKGVYLVKVNDGLRTTVSRCIVR